MLKQDMIKRLISKFRASYGAKVHYQRLAMESRAAWVSLNERSQQELFVGCGMLRVQPTDELGSLEEETLANMEQGGLRDTQFVKSDLNDRLRAANVGWDQKLLDFPIPGSSPTRTFEAVMDSTAGFTYCSQSCAYFLKEAAAEGVKIWFGAHQGAVESLIEENKRAVGLRTKDGVFHRADIVVIAGEDNRIRLLNFSVCASNVHLHSRIVLDANLACLVLSSRVLSRQYSQAQD